MSDQSFLERQLEVQLTLDGDTFDGSNDSLTVSGLRCQTTIQSYNGSAGSFASQLQMRISGMKNEHMAKLSTLGFSSGTYTKNLISVRAGDAQRGLSEIFQGGIIYGNVDYNSMPDVGVELVASALANFQYPSAAANSWKGATDVAAMLSGLASATGLGFQNNGVATTLVNHAVGGSAWDQIRNICQAAGISYAISGGTLYIWPGTGNRDDTVIELSRATGLVGYPAYIVNGIEVTSIFNPNFEVGRQVKLTSSTPAPAANAPAQSNGAPAIGANGTFYAWGVVHDLSSQLPGGPWFSRVQLGTNRYNARG